MTLKKIAVAVATLALCVGFLFLGGPNEAQADDTLKGLEIMKKVSQKRQLDGSEAVIKMAIYNKKGDKRERKIAMATKMYDGGKTEKRVYKFLSPADVKGTGVLAFDYESKKDDMWIYLPALRKTRRIIASGKSKSFMGSEFTYADMNTPILENYNFKILKEEKIDGATCHVIEVLPKSDDIAREERYSKKIVWVAKSEFTIRKAEYYNLDGDLLKVLTAKNIRLVDPDKKRYRAMYMEMVNKKNGRKSVFEVDKIQFNPNVKDEFFTTAYIERP